jgi:hypothetical protein
MDDESYLQIEEWGTRVWRNKEGEFHKLDGPAIEYMSGYKVWYKNGLRHRLDGPAREFVGGREEWWEKGELHRLDGPAIKCADGTEWWLNDIHYKTKEEYFDKLSDEAKTRCLFSEDFLNG